MEKGAASESGQLQSVEIGLTGGGTRRFLYRESSRTDMSVLNQIFQAQHYNLSGLPLSPSLKKYANEASRNGESLLVVDAGANIGASALYFTQLDPRIHVCAVEPDPGNFMVLRENAMGLPITAVEAAVASEDGKLWLSDPGIGEWGFRVGSVQNRHRRRRSGPL